MNFCISQILVGQVDPARRPSALQLTESDGLELKFGYATCSVTLIEQQMDAQSDDDEPPATILVDCAAGYERQKLEQALAANCVRPSDITHLIITHFHSDHCGNMNLFPRAALISPETVKHEGLGLANARLPQGVRVDLFAGHSTGDIVVTVRTADSKEATEEETVQVVKIVGDLFEREGDWMDGGDAWRQNSLWPDRQLISRFLCWKGAHQIIPGHGAAFQCHGTFPCAAPQFGQIVFESLESDQSCRDREGSQFARVLPVCKFNVPGGRHHRIWAVETERRQVLLVNTGEPAQCEQLRTALGSLQITPDQVRYVVITAPSVHTVGNLNLFPNARIFMCADVSLPNNYYAAMDQFFTRISGMVVVWRDMDPMGDHGTLAVMVRTAPNKCALIGAKLDAFVLLYMSLSEDGVHFLKAAEPNLPQQQWGEGWVGPRI